MLGNYNDIANPAIADIAGALDIRQKRLDADESKRKEIRTNQLISEALPHFRDGSPLQELFKNDPKSGVFLAKTMGVPLNAGDQMQAIADDAHAVAQIAENDPEGAIGYVNGLIEQRQQMGLDTSKWKSWHDMAQQDPGKAIRTVQMMDKSLNGDIYRKREMEDADAKRKDRALDISENKDKTLSPFEQAQVKHWNDTTVSADGGLSNDAIELAATRLLNGEPASKVLANMGRGAQGAADIRSVQNRLAEKAKGSNIDATKILQNTQNVRADDRTFLELGAREGKIATAVQESQNFAKIALDASNKVPRDKFVPWNKLKNYSDSQLSDPNLAAFKAANTSLINAYARAVGGGSVTVHGQEEGEKMLNTATSPEAYNAVVQQILTETQAALDSPKQVREHIHGGGNHESPSADTGGKETAAQRYARLKGGN